MILSILLLLLMGAGPGPSTGGDSIVAVASNFATVAEKLAEEFAATTDSRVVLARVTRKSCEKLGLTEDKEVFAQVKSLAVLT